MEPSKFSQLYVVCLVVLGLVRAVITRLAGLMWGGVVLTVLAVGYLYASAAAHVRKFLRGPGRKRRFNRTL